MNLETLLRERGQQHGEWADNAAAAVRILTEVRLPPSLPSTLVHAMEMIGTKIARIHAGNPYEPDHWRDIAGYAMLAAKALEALEAED